MSTHCTSQVNDKALYLTVLPLMVFIVELTNRFVRRLAPICVGIQHSITRVQIASRFFHSNTRDISRSHFVDKWEQKMSRVFEWKKRYAI